MRICTLLLIGIFFACSVFAQESDKPGSGFERLARICDDAASIIDSERMRLGAAFEKELLSYLGDDVEKHDRISCHITRCCTKRNDGSLELLSLMIRQQALSLLRNKKDDHSLYTTVSLHIAAAVQSEELGFHALAIAHKSEADGLVSKRPILKGGFPAMSKEEWELFDSLPKQPLISKTPERRRRR